MEQRVRLLRTPFRPGGMVGARVLANLALISSGLNLIRLELDFDPVQVNTWLGVGCVLVAWQRVARAE